MKTLKTKILKTFVLLIASTGITFVQTAKAPAKISGFLLDDNESQSNLQP